MDSTWPFCHSRAMLFSFLRPALLAASALALAGCDQLGIESPATTKARVEADGKAIGGACRHAGRAIEDCYTLNRKADKGAVFAGWREMNDYMRENKIEAVPPPPPPPPPPESAEGEDGHGADGQRRQAEATVAEGLDQRAAQDGSDGGTRHQHRRRGGHRAPTGIQPGEQAAAGGGGVGVAGHGGARCGAGQKLRLMARPTKSRSRRPLPSGERPPMKRA